MKRLTHDGQKRGGTNLKGRRLLPDVSGVELLEAAMKVLRNRGPMNARVENVTDAAGAAKPIV